MQIRFDPSALRQTKWHEYAVRFLLGGLITAVAGVIAKKFGPSLGGLFLAFPAIFPASATLIEKHEKQKTEKEGLQGIQRAREATSVVPQAQQWEAWACSYLPYWSGNSCLVTRRCQF